MLPSAVTSRATSTSQAGPIGRAGISRLPQELKQGGVERQRVALEHLLRDLGEDPERSGDGQADEERTSLVPGGAAKPPGRQPCGPHHVPEGRRARFNAPRSSAPSS